MKISDLKIKANSILRNKGEEFVFDPLLEYVSGRKREFFFANSEHELNDLESELFLISLHKFNEGMPLAQIIGMKEFYSLRFFVNEHVLIPRPETEELVLEVSNLIKLFFPQKVNVLDVGTGCGNIILSLASSHSFLTGVGVDLSNECLCVAKRNAEFHRLNNRTMFFQSDLLNSVKGSFDIIVTNLPYIGTKRFNSVADSVKKYEPHLALFGGEDGLDLYRNLFSQIKKKSFGAKYVLGEFGFGQVDELSLILEKNAFSYSIKNDLAGTPRIFIVKL